MSRACLIKVETPPDAANDQAPAELPALLLTPELEAGLLALAPLVELVQARHRGRKRVRAPRVAALPERPKMTPAQQKAIALDLYRTGHR
jgi:hypothetical protein